MIKHWTYVFCKSVLLPCPGIFRIGAYKVSTTHPAYSIVCACVCVCERVPTRMSDNLLAFLSRYWAVHQRRIDPEMLIWKQPSNSPLVCFNLIHNSPLIYLKNVQKCIYAQTIKVTNLILALCDFTAAGSFFSSALIGAKTTHVYLNS